MKTYKIKIADSDCDYIYMSNEDPCKFIADLAKSESIKIEEVDRTSVDSINDISTIYQSIGEVLAK